MRLLWRSPALKPVSPSYTRAGVSEGAAPRSSLGSGSESEPRRCGRKCAALFTTQIQQAAVVSLRLARYDFQVPTAAAKSQLG